MVLKVLLCFFFFFFLCFFVFLFKLLSSGQVRSVFVLKRILMEVALSLSWLSLGLACALISVNKLKIKLKSKTGIPGGGSEQCSQVLRVTDMALRPPVTMYRVQHTYIPPLSQAHSLLQRAGCRGRSFFSSPRPAQQLPWRETAPSQECQAEG